MVSSFCATVWVLKGSEVPLLKFTSPAYTATILVWLPAVSAFNAGVIEQVPLSPETSRKVPMGVPAAPPSVKVTSPVGGVGEFGVTATSKARESP